MDGDRIGRATIGIRVGVAKWGERKRRRSGRWMVWGEREERGRGAWGGRSGSKTYL